LKKKTGTAGGNLPDIEFYFSERKIQYSKKIGSAPVSVVWPSKSDTQMGRLPVSFILFIKTIISHF